jgi:formate hydrogenlyase subunit 4
LALGRATLALAAMDTGTAVGGVAASRSMTLAALAGPALLLVIFAFALLAGSTNLVAIMRALRGDAPLAHAAPVFALLAAGIVALADTGRLPADGAAPDALAREYTGRYLALLQWGAALRLLTWLTLVAALFAPFGVADARAAPPLWLLGLLAWTAKIVVLAVALAVLEVAASRMRMARMVQLLALAMLSALLAVILLCVGQGFA